MPEEKAFEDIAKVPEDDNRFLKDKDKHASRIAIIGR